MPYGKTIELFLVHGTADSIITAEHSNWKEFRGLNDTLFRKQHYGKPC